MDRQQGPRLRRQLHQARSVQKAARRIQRRTQRERRGPQSIQRQDLVHRKEFVEEESKISHSR